MKKLVIFDLDGTLLNTIDDLAVATNVALEKCGFPKHPLNAYPGFVGNGIRKLMERALPDGERSEQNIERMLEQFKDYYDSHSSDMTKPYPGIPKLLKKLNDNGIRLAVASNKYQEATQKLIRIFFPDIEWVAIEGQKPDFPLKPDPSVVFDILSKSPTPKSDVLYVGDSGTDMETARRACVESCGVTWGFRPTDELRKAYANHIVATPDAIFAIICNS